MVSYIWISNDGNGGNKEKRNDKGMLLGHSLCPKFMIALTMIPTI
jgi:hypothetical protein